MLVFVHSSMPERHFQNLPMIFLWKKVRVCARWDLTRLYPYRPLVMVAESILSFTPLWTASLFFFLSSRSKILIISITNNEIVYKIQNRSQNFFNSCVTLSCYNNRFYFSNLLQVRDGGSTQLQIVLDQVNSPKRKCIFWQDNTSRTKFYGRRNLRNASISTHTLHYSIIRVSKSILVFLMCSQCILDT